MLYSPLHPRREQRLYQYITRLPGLVAYYPMWETDGTIAHNFAPANKKSLNGTISGPTVGQSGKTGKAYSFDGTNDQITTGAWSTATTSITMGAIYKSTDYTTNGQTIMSNGVGTNGTGRGYSIVLSGNATTDGSIFLLDHSVKWVDTTYNLQDNNPHFIVLVLNASGNPIVYVDGVSVFSPGSNTFSTPNGNGSLIGEGGDASFRRWAKGTMQHVFFATSVLSAGQILRLSKLAGF